MSEPNVFTNTSKTNCMRAPLTTMPSLIGLLSLFLLLSCTKVPQVSSITLNPENATLKINESVSISITILPEEANQTPIIWSSSNNSVASVESGRVTAKSQGEAIITAGTEGGGVSATCRITVIKSVESITLNNATCKVNVGESITLEATIMPEDASNKNVIWASSDEGIASVNGGVVRGIKGGTATITATSEESGSSATCEVIVWVPVTSIMFEKELYYASFGDELNIIPIVQPEDASDKTVNWSFTSSDVLEEYDGIFKAKQSGSVTITATTVDGEKQATTSVRVFGTGINNGHPYADMGLSVNWATYNIGTDTPAGWGDKFAWGETEPKEEYTWATYKFMQEGYADREHITKYTQDDGRWSINGIWWDDEGNFIGDGITQLEPQDDAAIVNWKGSWRMPTKAEQIELVENCYFSLVIKDGIEGYVYTSKINGESIFFPFANSSSSGYPSGLEYWGDYWSSTLYYYPYFAHISDIIHYTYNRYTWVGWSYAERYRGLSVRPVF